MGKIRGFAWKFGKNINTDVIIAGRYVNTTDPDELACHCMEDICPGFVNMIAPGDIIIADKNFGCGSSRESAPLAIKHAGISAVIAVSFARIFFRNAINIGLPVFQSADAYTGTDQGDEIEINPYTGLIKNLSKQNMFTYEPFNRTVLQIIEKGGLIPYVGERLAALKTQR